MLEYLKLLFSSNTVASLMRVLSALVTVSGIVLIFFGYFQHRLPEVEAIGLQMLAYGVGGKVGQKFLELILTRWGNPK